MAWPAIIAAAGSVAGGMMSSQGAGKQKMISTFSSNQKQVDQTIFDMLMGITRDNKGKEVSRDPWVQRMMKERYYQKTAPLTANQKAVQGVAAGMVNRVANTPRPDANYLAQLKQGVLPGKMKANPGVNFAKDGGTFDRNSTVVVGEDGPELVQALSGGGFKVIPNPKTTVADGLSKSKAASQKTGLVGMAAGGSVTPRKEYTDSTGKKYYIDTSVYKPGYAWKDNAGVYGNAYDQSLYNDFLSSASKDTALTSDANSWYNKLNSSWGGDITKATNAYDKSGKLKTGVNGKAVSGFYDAYNKYLGGLKTATSNAELDSVLGKVSADQYGDFYDYWKTSPYASADNDIVMRNNQIGYADPWNVDLGNTQAAIDNYYASKGYTKGADGNYVAPVAAAGNDWTGLAGKIDPAKYSEFNQFLDQYQGGVMKGGGLAWDPTTGGYAFQSPDANYAGVSKAVNDYLANGFTPPAVDGTTTTPTAEETQAAQQSQIYTDMINAMKGYLGNFDSAKANSEFDTQVLNPATKALNESTLPAIKQTMAGSNFFGSAREKAEQNSINQFNSDMAVKRSDYVSDKEQAYLDRGLSAINTMENLYKLPSDVAATQASTDNINAATANIFNNMAWTSALNDSNITNQQLSSLAMLWQLFEPEQQYDQSTLNDMMTNFFTEEGFNLPGLINVMSGYQNQNQMGVINDPGRGMIDKLLDPGKLIMKD